MFKNQSFVRTMPEETGIPQKEYNFKENNCQDLARVSIYMTWSDKKNIFFIKEMLRMSGPGEWNI